MAWGKFLGFLGEAGSRIFSWRDKRKKRAINDLSKEALTGDDSNKLSNKFKRVFGKRR